MHALTYRKADQDMSMAMLAGVGVGRLRWDGDEGRWLVSALVLLAAAGPSMASW